jgi:ubiquinone/menaquinone biosynthesis C-methylase UbiE
MAENASVIREEFDRIARLSGEDGWNPNSHYHEFLLRHVPPHASDALEIGCGAGAFSRLLAGRARQVTALDLSPEMIAIARERSAEFANITFEVRDVLAWDFPAERFDCIATIATLHHLPLEQMLVKMKRALKRGGVLLVLDLFEPEGLSDVVTCALALPVNFGLRLLKRRQLRVPREVRAVWAEHARHDSFPAISEVREACARLLPGAAVTRHLLWRYSIVWKKPVV